MNKSCSKAWSFTLTSGVALAMAMGAMGIGAAAADDETIVPPNRSIGYAVYQYKWAIHESKDAKDECPQGVNLMGPREQFKEQFPTDNGQKLKMTETWLPREAAVWWPTPEPDQFVFHEAQGKIAPGLNLDGKVKPADFTSTDGVAGIDNQMMRAIGCVPNYRTGASVLTFDDTFFKKYQVDRIMIELTDVDSLANDDDVTITTYRGRDKLVTDATGANYVPGGTQRLDLRFGKDFIYSAKGKIKDGIFTSEPMDYKQPGESAYQEAMYYWLRDARFQLRLTPTNAEGVVAGYADINTFHRSRNRQWSTHHLSYGQQSSASVYKALRRLADGFPDPVTGENTAISSAISLRLIQVHVLHDGVAPRQQQIADQTRGASAAQ